jgi:hypothetical protein
VLIARRPFSAADIETAQAAVARAKMELVYAPGQTTSNPFSDLLTSSDPERLFRSYPFQVTPVSDDQPFFFYTVQPRDLWNFLTSSRRDSADYKINRAVPLLFGLLGISIAAMAVILLLPPLVLKQALPRGAGARLPLLYFVAIGAGYILIQVAWIQKFVLFLGHPTYALTVIIFSMLVASSIGSRLSETPRPWAPLAVAGLIATAAFLVPGLTQAGITWPLPVKFVVSAAAIAPAALLMGMPFPQGMRWLEERQPEAVRWAWAVNAAASVLGSASAIFLAIYIGLRATLITGALCYLLAWWSSRLLRSDAVRAPALR